MQAQAKPIYGQEKLIEIVPLHAIQKRENKLVQLLDWIWNAVFYAELVREVGPDQPAERRHEFQKHMEWQSWKI